MKKSDISLNGVYANGRGSFREVLGLGNNYFLFYSQTDNDCVGYHSYRLRARWKGDVHMGEAMKRNDRHVQPRTGLSHITRASFASWAKRLATPEEIVLLQVAKGAG